MTVVRLNEWWINFKPHTATQTTPANDLAHSQINSQRLTSQQLATSHSERDRERPNRKASALALRHYLANARLFRDTDVFRLGEELRLR